MGKVNPEISVVMSIYNTEKYLKDALCDITEQTYDDWELICVDDGSNDCSREILSDWANKDNRIRIIRQENRGAGAARNIGLAEAKGEYVWFPDADDRFNKSFLKTMIHAMIEAEADIVVCASEALDEAKGERRRLNGSLDETLLPDCRVFSAYDISDSIFQLTAGWAWDKLYRRSFLINNNIRFQEIRVANDALMVFSSFIYAGRISTVSENLVTHRINNPISLEGSRSAYWKCGYEMLYAIKEVLQKYDEGKKYEYSFMKFAANYIIWNMNSISEKGYYWDFYRYTQSTGIKKLGIDIYTGFDDDDKALRDEIHSILEKDCESYLLYRVNSLSKEIDKQSREYLEWVRELENFNKFLSENIKIMYENKKWIAPKQSIEPGSRIIIYGFGDVGRDFYYDLNDWDGAKLVAVADKNYDKIREDVKLVDPRTIFDIDFDLILVASAIEKNTREIVDFLIDGGIPMRKIWTMHTDNEKKKGGNDQ